MLHNRFVKIVLFLIIPVVIAGFSFIYNYAGVLFSPGPVTLGHQEIKDSCFKCHAVFSHMTNACISCHEKVKESLNANKGFHGNLVKEERENCIQCHTDHKGERFFIINDKRDLKQLNKVTENVLKINRLAEMDRREIGSDYYFRKDDSDLKKPDFSWENQKKEIAKNFDHTLTGYPLFGEHAKVECEKCHKSIKEFKESAKTGLLPSFFLKTVSREIMCYSCHQKNDEGKKGHKGKYGKDCSQCHIDGGIKQGWKAIVPKVRDFHKDTKYLLKGKHKKVECSKCHEATPFKKKEDQKTCLACHSKDDQKIHESTLGKKCEACHTEEKFTASIFDHQKTKFPLLYSHKKVKCAKCHSEWSGESGKKKIFRAIKKMDCFSCHARDDIHHGSFQNDCARCHRETYWGDIIGR